MIAIIDYQAGNLTSVKLAFDTLHAEAVITADPNVLKRAERVVFPGVGAAAAAMSHLHAMGLTGTIREIVDAGTPFLGICLGTQIICSLSDEDGGVTTLGLIPGHVRKFTPRDPRDKVPHMGWNQVHFTCKHPLFAGIPDNRYFYFVHGYYPDPESCETILGTTDYAGVRFASAIGKNNLAAVQFHPEKSGSLGLRLLHNFTKWNGARAC